MYFSYSTNQSVQIFINPGFLTGAMVIAGFVTGTSLLMWLGEQITNKGVGNVISMIIFVGIISLVLIYDGIRIAIMVHKKA